MMDTSTVLRCVGAFLFVYIGAAVWVVLFTGGEDWVGIVFAPAYVLIVLVAFGIAGAGYWAGEKMGLGE
ncbi:hypothetical protein CP556_13355 [Natrinema sp. CBA1119]|nr:hypothetical protein CP556_13355 [Natrinema sp. CBA1119]